ncbi:MAG: PilZ domain-containing protein [Deltaproteobacteria bacterium]|nr:PilZ domain-containing protein [Deltaproteobacteria bacterium]
MNEESKRENVRIQTDALLDYTGTEVLLFHKIENLSLGGLSIHSASVEPVGTRVFLTINFPDLRETVELEGEVVWSRNRDPREMGIRFVDLSSRDEAVLSRYIAARSQ